MKLRNGVGLLVMVLGTVTVLASGPPTQEAPERVWDIPASPEATRSALLAVLDAEHLGLDPEAPEGTVQTNFSRFEAKHFGTDSVAEPPPPITQDYMFLQRREAVVGRYRVRARLEPAAEGTRVTVAVDIFVPAFHEMIAGGAEAPRVSNGVIEDYLKAHLLEKLPADKPEPAEPPPPPRR